MASPIVKWACVTKCELCMMVVIRYKSKKPDALHDDLVKELKELRTKLSLQRGQERELIQAELWEEVQKIIQGGGKVKTAK